MAVTITREGQRVYFGGDTFAAKDRIKSLGGHWDGDRKAWWIGAKKLAEAEALVASLSAPVPIMTPTATEDVSDCRVYAQVEYKGRRYYVIAETRDLTRCRLTTLDGTAPFWVDCSACNLVRRYEGREVWDGRRYSGKTVTRYQTIGSLREFRDSQRQGERDGMPACAACGKRSDSLVSDLEDGLMKCRACCDIEP